jgi:hypothetical protein
MSVCSRGQRPKGMGWKGTSTEGASPAHGPSDQFVWRSPRLPHYAQKGRGRDSTVDLPPLHLSSRLPAQANSNLFSLTLHSFTHSPCESLHSPSLPLKPNLSSVALLVLHS